MVRLSVVLPAHDPNPRVLDRVVAALRDQDLAPASWELVIVDNASRQPAVFAQLDLAWHPNARVIREPRLGLTAARCAGVRAAAGDVIVFVDDDNVLSASYLRTVLHILDANPGYGAIGGRVTPEYAAAPPAWLGESHVDLGCRDLGDAPLHEAWNDGTAAGQRYPACAPIGAGLSIRRTAIVPYVERVLDHPQRSTLDRTGDSLASGGDCDIVMSALRAGWTVAYAPELHVLHCIAGHRVQPAYLRRMARESMRTWTIVLHVHGVCPWAPIPRWAVAPRKLLALWRLRPWRGPVERIRWHSAAGQFEGRAMLRDIPRLEGDA